MTLELTVLAVFIGIVITAIALIIMWTLDVRRAYRRGWQDCQDSASMRFQRIAIDQILEQRRWDQ